MPTIAEQLNELVNQKKALVSNLNTKGVSATEDEKLNTLVPKVLEITSGGGGIDTSDATATSDVILQGKTAYVDGQLVIGTLPIISGQTINPSASATTITAAAFLKEDIIIKGDSNLISSNIRKGVKIFNIIGSYEGENNNED